MTATLDEIFGTKTPVQTPTATGSSNTSLDAIFHTNAPVTKPQPASNAKLDAIFNPQAVPTAPAVATTKGTGPNKDKTVSSLNPKDLVTPIKSYLDYSKKVLDSGADPIKAAASKVMEDVKNRGNTLGSELNAGVHVAGDIAHGVAGSIGGVFKAAVMDPASQALEHAPGIDKVANSAPVSGGLDALASGHQFLTDKWNAFESQHPDAARSIKDAGNIAQFMTLFVGDHKPLQEGVSSGVDTTVNAIKEGGDKGLDIMKNTAGEIGDLYKSITTKTPEEADAYIQKAFEKGVRPSVAGKGTIGQAEAYQNKALDAVKTIVENKPNLKLTNEFGEETGKLPTNLREFSQAIDQTKKTVFDQYDALQKAAGSAGAEVRLEPISTELRAIQNDPVIQDLHPEIAKYAQARAEALDARGGYSTQQAQDAIANLNKSLDAFYKNPSYETASKASVDAMIANKLREGLDTAIEGATGEEYQALKNKYGALRTIEKDVVHRAMIDARKNNKSLIDFSDVATGAEVVKGLATMNPSTVATGLAGKAIAAYYKYLNNPNTAIKQMFNVAEKSGLSEPKPLSPEEVKSELPSK